MQLERRWLFALLSCLILLNSQTAFAACPKPDDIVSVSTFFEYNNSEKFIPRLTTRTDAAGYSSLAERFTKDIRNLTDANVLDKQTYLENLARLTKGKKYVNFNFSGHGMLVNGKFVMALPGLPAYCATAGVDPKQLVFSQKKLTSSQFRTCSDFFVTQEDLKSVLKDKKVFGVFDTCYSGPLEISNDSAIYSSSGRESRSFESRYVEGGAFSQRFFDILNGDSVCPVDKDMNGFISFNEMTVSLYPVSTPLNQGTKKKPSFVAQIPEATGMKKKWLKCIPLGKPLEDCKLNVQEDNLYDDAKIFPTWKTTGNVDMICQLPAGDQIVTTGRKTNDGMVEVLTSKEGPCNGARGWMGASLLIDEGGPSRAIKVQKAVPPADGQK